MRGLIVLAALVLTACERAPSEPAPAPSRTTLPEAITTPTPTPTLPKPQPPKLTLAGNGLTLRDPAGQTHTLAFGSPWPRAGRALIFRGPARRGSMDECGAGPMDYVKWEDSLTLYGMEGKFVGWFVDTGAGAGLATAAGLRPGRTRRDLTGIGNVEVFESTLGTEFLAANGLAGLLDGTGPAARITHLWAGETCAMR